MDQPMERSRPHPHRRFTAEEDAILSHLLNVVCLPDWEFIASKMPGRTLRQCRERWLNYLNPNLTNAPWTDQEEEILDQKVFEFGTAWNRIRPFLPGRSKNQIRHHWASKCRGTPQRSVSPPPVSATQPHGPASPQKDDVRLSEASIEAYQDLFKFDEEGDHGIFDFAWRSPVWF
jgi:hypothetical protein